MKKYALWMFGVGLVLSVGMMETLPFMPGPARTPPAAPVPRSANPTPSNVQIRIVSPRQDAIVPVGQNKVEISTENVALDALHPWHLYLDGKLIGTFGNGETTFSLPIAVSGPHEIKATLSDAQNADLASASIQVTAAPATPTSSPFNLTWVAPTMAVLLIGVVVLLLVSLRLTRRT